MTQWIMKKIAGKEGWQSIFKNLLRLSLDGMNYGYATDLKESGELNAINFLKKVFDSRTRISVFDVGGNLGHYSRALAEALGPKATIYAFEPSLKTFNQFIENTKDINAIKAINMGFSDKEEKSPLYMDHELSTLASVYPRNLTHHEIKVSQVEEVRLTTIDRFCEKNDIDKIDFLKLDIEGHELKALRGAQKMIEGDNIDCIQFEFGGCNIDSRTFFQDFYYLLIEKYRLFRIVRNGLVEIKKYEETNEIFRTINYLAQHRRHLANDLSC
jgi:FkbM family methyltransferase